MSKLLLLIPFFLLCTACSSTHERETVPEHIKKLENLTVYPADTEPDLDIRLVREQSFGSSDEVLIGSIVDIDVDESGRVFIGDSKQHTIHVLGPNGHYLIRLGREGRGPGEFTTIGDIKIVSGHLIALDVMMARMNVFSTDTLAFARTANITPRNTGNIEELAGASPRRYTIRNDGQFLVSFSRPLIASRANEAKYLPYYLLNAKGAVVSDKILEMRDYIYLTTTINGNPRFAAFSFTPHSIVVLSRNDDIYTAWTSDFLIKVQSPDGEYLRSFYYPYDRVPIDRDKLLNNYPHEYHKKIIRNTDLPEAWPAMAHMLLDDENRIWVSTIVDDPQVYQWWVLDEQGKLLTRFTWPRDRRIEVIKDSYLYTRETEEETGLQHIVRYRIEME